MKTFMEEYGTVVVVAIIVLALIGVGLFFRSEGSESIRNTVKGFLNQAELDSAVADGSGNGDSGSHSGGGSGSDEPTCFVAGTQVQYDLEGHTKNIEDFQAGDQVVSYDVNTGKQYIAKVTGVTRHESLNELSTVLAEATLADGTVVNMTLDHRLLTDRGWVCVDSEYQRFIDLTPLHVGDRVMTANGYVSITKLNIYHCDPTPTYCLMVMDYDEEVDDDTDDNFYVNGIVAHNEWFVPEIEMKPAPELLPEEDKGEYVGDDIILPYPGDEKPGPVEGGGQELGPHGDDPIPSY